MTRSTTVAVLLVALAALRSPAHADDHAFRIECDDGYRLDAVVERPEADAKGKVIILLHGSGPQSMDVDLTPVTKGGKENLFFRDLSAALVDAGFTVIRYHKRSHQIALSMRSDPAFAQGEVVRATSENPMKWFVDDAKACVRQAKTGFPEAEVFLLGHSQGAYIALQVAHEIPDVKGVALVAFALGSTDLLLFEQTVYRPLGIFDRFDANRDGDLDATELAGGDPIAMSLRAQSAILDLNGDQLISRDEFQAGNLSNLLIRDIAAAVRVQEATYPRLADILRDASFKVVFFQGLWDNQTPAYNAKAVQITATHVWRKQDFRYVYFPGLGHALDVRTAYDDIEYDTMDPAAQTRLVQELVDFF
jgi:pimeloyl-ACP methyl ester carboxylesterase